MAMPAAGLPSSLKSRGIGLRAHLDARDVFYPYEATALGGLVLDDDVGKLARVVEPGKDVYSVLKLLVLRSRRHADLPGRDLLALLLNSAYHVLRH
jgi:hypothetical protein